MKMFLRMMALILCVSAVVTAGQGGAVRLSVAAAGITFEGKLAADGNSIVGTFTQGPGSLPLTLNAGDKRHRVGAPGAAEEHAC